MIHGQSKASERMVANISRLRWPTCAFASIFFAQSPSTGFSIPASVTVQTNEAKDFLSAPPVLGSEPDPANAASLFAPVKPSNTPKIYAKGAPSGPAEMDLCQLWTELKLNNPQLSSLRESYLSAKATVPQIAAPANPQVGFVWSGMPVNSPFSLGGANTPTPQY